MFVNFQHDHSSQIWGSCVASANSPLAEVEMGIRRWIDLGVDPAKLILGLPWYDVVTRTQHVHLMPRYGYLYPCTNPEFAQGTSTLFTLRPTPFRGAPCSDAAGRQVCFGELQRMLRPAHNDSEVVCEDAQFDDVQHARYARCVDRDGQHYQLWWDDAKTLRAKYALAARYGLRGVGFWNVDCLECQDEACRQASKAMWRAVHDGLYGTDVAR